MLQGNVCNVHVFRICFARALQAQRLCIFHRLMPDTLYNRDYNPSGFAVYDVRFVFTPQWWNVKRAIILLKSCFRGLYYTILDFVPLFRLISDLIFINSNILCLFRVEMFLKREKKNCTKILFFRINLQ